MAVCNWCDQDMLKVDDCSGNRMVKYPNGIVLPAIPYDYEGRCHDCGIFPGNYHHPGCDMEQCPNCKGQLISCGCLDEIEIDTGPVAMI